MVLVLVLGIIAILGLPMVVPAYRRWLELGGRRHPVATSVLYGAVIGLGFAAAQIAALGWHVWPLVVPLGLFMSVFLAAFRTRIHRRRLL